MVNVVRTQFQGKDARLNINKGILTVYNGEKTKRYNVKVELDLPIIREFLATAYANGKNPSKSLAHKTEKNGFIWDKKGLTRFDFMKVKVYTLSPNTKHTTEILQAMVRANVK
jgi:hypothetical protein